MRASGLILGVLFVLSARGLAGQAVLAGTIRDDSTGRPLEGAEILIESSAKRAVSRSSGAFAIAGVSSGNHIALVRLVGYAPVRIAIRTSGSDTTWLNALLTPSAQPLEPITVTAREWEWHLRVFEENRRLGFGHFFDSTYLRKWETVNLSVLVTRVPGVGVTCDPYPFGVYYKPCYAVNKRCLQGGGFMRVYVDGQPSTNTDIRTGWQTSELSAVEVYRSPAEIPAMYNSARSACGVIALWTRKP